MRRQPFLDPADNLFVQVTPYRGKYAAKIPDFFHRVSEIQKARMPDEWVYRPLNAEIEITSKCNQHCAHCGMGAGKDGISYSQYQLSSFVDELFANGIISLSITGGEPFLEFDNMLYMMQKARYRVDIMKITTNGYWGDKAKDYFEKMVSAGLLDNQYLVPVLMVSIGEQTTPMETTCNIFHTAIEMFKPEQLTLCLSSLAEYAQQHKTIDFIETYEKLFGRLPIDRIYLTSADYRESQLNPVLTRVSMDYNVSHWMHGPIKCFAQTIGRYILPRMLVKAQGLVCTCACFNPPPCMYHGDFRSQTLKEILTDINKDDIVRLIAKNGLAAFKPYMPFDWCLYEPACDECTACQKLIKKYNELPTSCS